MKIAFPTILLYFIFSGNLLFGQSPTERDNRAVYNRIEYFFNTQQIDSIYNLGSHDFKSKTSLESMNKWLSHFVQLGRITDSYLLDYNQGIANYELQIGDKHARVKLAVDSNLQYTLFLMGEIQTTTPQVEEEPILSQVEKVDKLDHFVDSVARNYVGQLQNQSLAIGIIANNKVKTFFYGETEKGNGTLPTASSIYEIGSISKTFTATLLALLVEKGDIQLDDSIAQFLPDSVASNPYIQKITFRSLANHTSGLPRLPDNIENTSDFDPHDPYATYGRKELFEFLKSFQSETAPGDQYEYSNLGYGLLGELVSIITARPYDQLVQDSITKPLDMLNTVQTLHSENQVLTPPHDGQGEKTSPWTFQAMSGAGALKSTVNDLLKYAHIQFLIPKNRLEQAMMMTRQFSYFIPPDTDIGLAWHMNMLGGLIYYWHNGGTAGSSSFIALAPDSRAALVVLSNSASSVDDISIAILQKIILAE